MVRVVAEVPVTLPALLADRAATRGAHPLLVSDDEALTYGDAERRSAELARGLVAAGAGKGSHIGLLFPNGADFVVAAFAAARIGAVVVPFSTVSTATELRQLLAGADIEVLLSEVSYRGRDYAALVDEAIDGHVLDAGGPLLLAAFPALRRVAFAHDGPSSIDALIAEGHGIDAALSAALEARVLPGDRLLIAHTSGSTGVPKGVVHQHGPLLQHQAHLNVLRGLAADEILFSNSPFFWISGFAYSLLGTTVAGATLVCSNATDAERTLDLLERTRPTMVNGFAQTVAHLAAAASFGDRDLSSIRRGNLWPIMPDDIAPADPELRHNLFGMTETGSVCLMSDDESDQPEHRRGSFGRPVTGWESKIVDPETGVDCATGVVGELWLRSPYLMEGYSGRPRHECFEPDGWFRTGDLFHVDADGFHYFTGRRDDMIKTAGANVSPREVEAAITEITGLAAHVVGLDDERRGQLVAAAVRVPLGQQEPDTEQLRADLRARLSAYKVPKLIAYVPDEEVPMLSTGKLDSRALKEWLADRAAR